MNAIEKLQAKYDERKRVHEFLVRWGMEKLKIYSEHKFNRNKQAVCADLDFLIDHIASVTAALEKEMKDLEEQMTGYSGEYVSDSI